MATTQDYINQLKVDKQNLVSMLNNMGVEATDNETFTSLTPKVGKIVTDPILQDKTVEITENGITNIVADEGYNGLNNVEVTTNVEKTGVTNEIYSTTETKTGRTWIDGKPIYRKVFSTNLPTINHDYSQYSYVTINVADLQIENVVGLDGVIKGEAYWTLNWYHSIVGASAGSYIGDNRKTLVVRTNCNWLSKCPIIVVLEYTKTTD